jgi:hypothetical protein
VRVAERDPVLDLDLAVAAAALFPNPLSGIAWYRSRPGASISALKPPTGWRAPGCGAGSVSGAPGNGAGADASAASVARASNVVSVGPCGVAKAGAAHVIAATTAPSTIKRLIESLPVATRSGGIGPCGNAAQVTHV